MRPMESWPAGHCGPTGGVIEKPVRHEARVTGSFWQGHHVLRGEVDWIPDAGSDASKDVARRVIRHHLLGFFGRLDEKRAWQKSRWEELDKGLVALSAHKVFDAPALNQCWNEHFAGWGQKGHLRRPSAQVQCEILQRNFSGLDPAVIAEFVRAKCMVDDYRWLAAARDFVAMTYIPVFNRNGETDKTAARAAAGLQRRYFKSMPAARIAGLHRRVLPVPPPVAPGNEPQFGAAKWLSGRNEKMVALQAYPGRTFRRRNNDDLQDISHVIVNHIVDKDLMLAANGGKELFGLGPLPAGVFRGVLDDLKRLHEERMVFLVDIKAENAVFDGKAVRLIDVDDRCSVTEKIPNYTKDCTTMQLVALAEDLASPDRGQVLATIDDYAMAMLLVGATTGNEHLKYAFYNPPPHVFNTNGVLETLDADDRRAFQGWVAEHVKPGCEAWFTGLLTNPVTSLDVVPARPALVDMLTFQPPVA